MDIDKLLGFANRAGKLAIGRFAVMKAVKLGRSKTIIISLDASEKIMNELTFLNRDLKIIRYGEKSKLGRLLGRNEVAVIAICDSQLSEAFWDLEKNES